MIAELSLFLGAFLAATILPFSSEAAFLVALSNDMPKESALFFASSGNLAAIAFNFFLGFWLYEKSKSKLLSSKIGSNAILYGHKYGYAALLASWLPIIGDPLTIVAGLLRLNFIWFFIIAGSLRVARYYALTLMI